MIHDFVQHNSSVKSDQPTSKLVVMQDSAAFNLFLLFVLFCDKFIMTSEKCLVSSLHILSLTHLILPVLLNLQLDGVWSNWISNSRICIETFKVNSQFISNSDNTSANPCCILHWNSATIKKFLNTDSSAFNFHCL